MIKDISIDIIPMDIYFVDTLKSLIKLLNKLNIEDDIDINGDGYCSYGISNGTYYGIIVVKSLASVGTVAHEANHMVQYIMEEFEFTDQHEFKSYSIEYLVNEITHYREKAKR